MGYNSICNESYDTPTSWMCNEGELGGMQELKRCDCFQVGMWSLLPLDMDVSENRGVSPQIIPCLIGFFIINYKPSILGCLNFWKHPDSHDKTLSFHFAICQLVAHFLPINA